MPWLLEAKKDVTSCEKLREGANDFRSVDIRMGQPSRKVIREIGSKPGELKHLSIRRKRKQ